MIVYLVILVVLIVSICFVSFGAYWLHKGNKEARRIMDRFYAFAVITSTEAQMETISKEQQETLILDMREAVVGGSVLQRLRKLDAVMDRSSERWR